MGILYRGRSERMKSTLSSGLANFKSTRKDKITTIFRHVQFQLGTILSAEYLFDNPLGIQMRAVHSSRWLPFVLVGLSDTVLKVFLKMAVISTLLLLLAGLCLCQANVVVLTNENFDSVSFLATL